MKLPSKPISSPGRAEKYPPPLMRFLRSNVSSRSKGRSRSSPMFIRNKKAASSAIETQEPSSPKVTCMGQVRVKRSKKTRPDKRKNHCKWIKKLLFCHHQFNGKLKPKCSKPSWKKWVGFFRLGFQKKSDLAKKDPKFGEDSVQEGTNKKEDEDEEDDREIRVYVPSATISPPKNAFLLTRSRSAPYRSSSLASRFWGSPLETEEETEQKQSTEAQTTEEYDSPILKNESNSDQELKLVPEIQEKAEFFKEFEGPVASIRERIMNLARIEELKTTTEEEGSVITERPLILTRCKSEPARTAERLDPELSFWKKRRLGFT